MAPTLATITDRVTGARPELEIKYLVPRANVPFLLRWLEGVATPERAYPPALVVTTYYDTPGLELLDEKIDSDFLKTKVRVRWYAPLDGGAPGEAAFLEVKGREGATRGKRRLRLDEPASRLARLPLHAAAWTALAGRLHDEVPGLPRDLAPVLRLAYARSRFVDPFGTRLSVDTDIEVQDVNHRRLAAPARHDALAWAVFEYKGHAAQIPPHLAPVTRVGARRSSFSKYLACYEHVTRRAF